VNAQRDYTLLHAEVFAPYRGGAAENARLRTQDPANRSGRDRPRRNPLKEAIQHGTQTRQASRRRNDRDVPESPTLHLDHARIYDFLEALLTDS
jgi:hypothetical protein